ncbi:inositol monophosphatase family protein [Bartonella sp. DGB1]|uniref:inositol monophosphatase family protein n=1 Tax=Bartonella sp. DGB1 TaxID=3239807 RepID=UPI00352423C5
MSRSALLNVMVQAALKAGKALNRYFNEIEKLQVSLKGPGDYVTHADKKAEQIIFEELQYARPDYGFIMEERGEIPGKDKQHRWIVDPLDGTTNFLHGLPFFAISIALERQGQIVAAVIYNPVLDELFTAEKGGGVFLNDRRIRVANRRLLVDSIVATGIPSIAHPNHGQYISELKNLMTEVASIRHLGAASLNLAYVAAGKLDGYWENNLKPWDIAAGLLMVREAGGFVTDRSNRLDVLFNNSLVAGNEYIHKALLKLWS